MLIVIGGWALLQLKRGKQNREAADSESFADLDDPSTAVRVKPGIGELSGTALVVMVELKRLGLVIQILRTPQAADVDKSGIISASEAIMLGVALSLDAFGAGLGAAMIGIPALPTALTIALASAVFLVGGMRFGFRFSAWKGMQALSFLPGLLLIMMGIMKLL